VERKRQLGRSRLKWEFNVEVDVKTIEWGVVDWINLAQDRNNCRAVLNTVMNLRNPQNAGNFFIS
jgi:peptide subunit release factor RF-3